MKKIIIPTDFSDTSLNAARYAGFLAGHFPNCSLLLYNSFDGISTGSEGTSVFSDVDARKKIATFALDKLRQDIALTSTATIDVLAEEGSLVNNLERLHQEQGFDLVVMGITGATKIEQLLIGSNTLKLIQRNICPVLIIPPSCTFKPIRKVVFASDFNELESAEPAASLLRFIHLVRADLHIAYVESAPHLAETYLAQKEKMNQLFNTVNPVYDVLEKGEFTEVINQYAEKNKADMLVIIPRKQHFLRSLFSTSHTQKLAYHTHLPLLTIHE